MVMNQESPVSIKRFRTDVGFSDSNENRNMSALVMWNTVSCSGSNGRTVKLSQNTESIEVTWGTKPNSVNYTQQHKLGP